MQEMITLLLMVAMSLKIKI